MDKKKEINKKNNNKSFFMYFALGMLIFLGVQQYNSTVNAPESKSFTVFKNEIYFCEISDGDLFKTGSHNQKAAEIFRSYGVNKSLREVWPVLKLKDTILWIPGIRKSSEGNWLETQKDKFIISASTEKVSIENF